MSLIVYTQEEVDAILPDRNGIRHFPTGNYSIIKKFENKCNFENRCVFGEFCKFSKECVFGGCCLFGDFCEFNDHCAIGDLCEFGKDCTFEKGCSFGSKCTFGDYCKFLSPCYFENGYKAKTSLPFIAFGWYGCEADTCYFFNFEEGIYVRTGCFIGTVREFKAKVLKDEETPYPPSKKTKVYLAFCDIVETIFYS